MRKLLAILFNLQVFAMEADHPPVKHGPDPKVPPLRINWLAHNNNEHENAIRLLDRSARPLAHTPQLLESSISDLMSYQHSATKSMVGLTLKGITGISLSLTPRSMSETDMNAIYNRDNFLSPRCDPDILSPRTDEYDGILSPRSSESCDQKIFCVDLDKSAIKEEIKRIRNEIDINISPKTLANRKGKMQRNKAFVIRINNAHDEDECVCVSCNNEHVHPMGFDALNYILQYSAAKILPLSAEYSFDKFFKSFREKFETIKYTAAITDKATMSYNILINMSNIYQDKELYAFCPLPLYNFYDLNIRSLKGRKGCQLEGIKLEHVKSLCGLKKIFNASARTTFKARDQIDAVIIKHINALIDKASNMDIQKEGSYFNPLWKKNLSIKHLKTGSYNIGVTLVYAKVPNIAIIDRLKDVNHYKKFTLKEKKALLNVYEKFKGKNLKEDLKLIFVLKFFLAPERDALQTFRKILSDGEFEMSALSQRFFNKLNSPLRITQVERFGIINTSTSNGKVFFSLIHAGQGETFGNLLFAREHVDSCDIQPFLHFGFWKAQMDKKNSLLTKIKKTLRNNKQHDLKEFNDSIAFAMQHGDMHPANVMYDFKRNSIFMIDSATMILSTRQDIFEQYSNLMREELLIEMNTQALKKIVIDNVENCAVSVMDDIGHFIDYPFLWGMKQTKSTGGIDNVRTKLLAFLYGYLFHYNHYKDYKEVIMDALIQHCSGSLTMFLCWNSEMNTVESFINDSVKKAPMFEKAIGELKKIRYKMIWQKFLVKQKKSK